TEIAEGELHLLAGFLERLTVLERHQPGELVTALLHQLLDREHEPAAIFRRQHRPFTKGGVGGGDRTLDLRRGAVGHRGHDALIGRIDHIERGAAIAQDPLAVDVHVLDVVGHRRPPSRYVTVATAPSVRPAPATGLDALRYPRRVLITSALLRTR